MSVYQRINFRYSTELAVLFDELSNKLGKPKSRLLREWIKEDYRLRVSSSSNKYTVARSLSKNTIVDNNAINTTNKNYLQSQDFTKFNFRISLALADNLDFITKQLRISRSKYLRALIALKVNLVTSNKDDVQVGLVSDQKDIDYQSDTTYESSRSIAPYSVTTRAYISGTDEVSDWDNLSTANLIAISRKSIRAADLGCASQIIEYLEQRLINKPRTHVNLISVDIVRALIARHQRKLKLSLKLFDQAKQRAKQIEDWRQLITIYSEIGVIYSLQDQVDKALKYSQHSLKISRKLDRYIGFAGRNSSYRVRHPQKSYISGLLRVIDLFALQQDQEQMNKYISFVTKLMDQDLLGPKLRIKVLNRLALADIRLGDLRSAWQKLELARMELDSAEGLDVEKRYNFEDLAITHLIQGDVNKAYAQFESARRMENKFRKNPASQFSKSQLFLCYIRSKQNFDSNFNIAKEIVDLQHRPIYLSLGRYVMYSMMYVNGGIVKKEIGKQKLGYLVKYGDNKMIRNAAAMTLKHNRLWPVI